MYFSGTKLLNLKAKARKIQYLLYLCGEKVNIFISL